MINYMIAYIKHIRTIFFWGHVIWMILPKTMKQYFIATILVDAAANDRVSIKEDSLKEFIVRKLQYNSWQDALDNK